MEHIAMILATAALMTSASGCATTISSDGIFYTSCAAPHTVVVRETPPPPVIVVPAHRRGPAYHVPPVHRPAPLLGPSPSVRRPAPALRPAHTRERHSHNGGHISPKPLGKIAGTANKTPPKTGKSHR